MLAAAVGSVWYSFVDAVSGFNQIRNTKRAREVLAIVARSGKYLPIGLTLGPVNGPDDFNYAVDRAAIALYQRMGGMKLKQGRAASPEPGPEGTWLWRPIRAKIKLREKK